MTTLPAYESLTEDGVWVAPRPDDLGCLVSRYRDWLDVGRWSARPGAAVLHLASYALSSEDPLAARAAAEMLQMAALSGLPGSGVLVGVLGELAAVGIAEPGGWLARVLAARRLDDGSALELVATVSQPGALDASVAAAQRREDREAAGSGLWGAVVGDVEAAMGRGAPCEVLCWCPHGAGGPWSSTVVRVLECFGVDSPSQGDWQGVRRDAPMWGGSVLARRGRDGVAAELVALVEEDPWRDHTSRSRAWPVLCDPEVSAAGAALSGEVFGPVFGWGARGLHASVSLAGASAASVACLARVLDACEGLLVFSSTDLGGAAAALEGARGDVVEIAAGLACDWSEGLVELVETAVLAAGSRP